MKTSPPLQIAKPCPVPWETMQGGEKRRFCDQCQLHVYNLSAMSPAERDAMVEQTGGQACISYVLRPDGTMVTTTWRTRMAAPFRRVGYALATLFATVFPFAFGACKTPSRQEFRTGGVMCPPEGYGKDNAAPSKPHHHTPASTNLEKQPPKK